MKILFVVIVLLCMVGFVALIIIDTQNVNQYWNDQIEISYDDSLDFIVTETKYLRGYLSFNKKFFIIDANVVKSNIELWQVQNLRFPYRIKKSSESDTLHLFSSGKQYYFVLDN